MAPKKPGRQGSSSKDAATPSRTQLLRTRKTQRIEHSPLRSPSVGPEESVLTALDIAKKLGFQGDQTKDYTNWVANLKDEFIIKQHPEIIEGPKSLQERGRPDLWQAAIQDLINGEPRFCLDNFHTQDLLTRAAQMLLKNQAKKVRLRKPATGDLGNKRPRETFEDSPRIDQTTVGIDLSKLPSPDFAIFLWGPGLSSPFLNRISPLVSISSLQTWVCTKLRIPSGAAKIEAVFPVYNEDFLDVLGMEKCGGKTCLDVSDQASWDSVVSLAQQVAREPAKFVGLRLEARKATTGELELNRGVRKPASDSPDPKRSKTLPRGGGRNSNGNSGGKGNNGNNNNGDGNLAARKPEGDRQQRSRTRQSYPLEECYEDEDEDEDRDEDEDGDEDNSAAKVHEMQEILRHFRTEENRKLLLGLLPLH